MSDLAIIYFAKTLAFLLSLMLIYVLYEVMKDMRKEKTLLGKINTLPYTTALLFSIVFIWYGCFFR